MMLYSKKNVKTISFCIALGVWAMILIVCEIWQKSETMEQPTTSITLKAEKTQETNREKTVDELLLESMYGGYYPNAEEISDY